MKFKFQVGDRVTRPIDVYSNCNSSLKTGTVIKCYSELPNYPQLFDVIWDGKDKIDTGYLPHGLEKLK